MLPIFAAPATGNELNTVTAAIIPVACWRVDDIRFEFDSSVVTPGIKTELDELTKLIAKHPKAPLSVFGHADPVGNDDYNKALSGRRATAIYALLIRDTGLWEELFSTPLGNDRWGRPALTLMADTVAPGPGAEQLAADAERSAGARGSLFARYMDALCGPSLRLAKSDFLARGENAAGKGDFQGCSEFNPVLIFSAEDQRRFDQSQDKSERNAANAPNRRVMVLLFRKGSKVVPDRWPCPTAKEGPAGCRKRFWSDGESRRTRRLPTAERRFLDTEDTFACRFYHRLTTSSPCEDIPVVSAAKIEFVLDSDADHKAEASGAVATFLRMGLWDNAFDPPAAGSPAGTANALANAAAEDKNFVGADTRRFYLRVTDPDVAGRVKADWRTLKEDDSNLDRPADQSVTLLETQTGSGVFVSRALMLVSDGDDQNQQTDSGLAAGDPNAGQRAQGQADHRIRRGSMRGFVEAEYAPRTGPKVTVKLPVFERNPESRRTLPLQIFVMRRVAGGASVIATTPGSTVFSRDLRILRETYERIGMSVTTVVAARTAEANIARDGADALVLIDPSAGVNAFAVDDAAEQAIATATPAIDANTIRVYYAGRLTSGNRGEAAPVVDFARRSDVATAFLNGALLGTAPYSPAHEVGHILTNKSASVSGGHYRAPTAPAGNKLLNDQNLMRNGTSQTEGVLESKRLWDANDQDAVNEFTSMRGSNFTRAFA
jgi:hypothetical protein